MLTQQGFLKALHATQPTNMDDAYWEDLKEKVTMTIQLCLKDEVVYHFMDLTSLKGLWTKLES